MKTRMLWVALLIFGLANSHSPGAANEAGKLDAFWRGWKSQVLTGKVKAAAYCSLFARQSSPQVLPLMVRDLHEDRSDDRFFPYALVAVKWNPDACRKILTKIMRSDDRIDRIWAHEFLTEINSYNEAKKNGQPWQ